MAYNSTLVIKIKMCTQVKQKVRGKTSLTILLITNIHTYRHAHTQTPSPLNNHNKCPVIPQKNVSMYMHIVCIMHRRELYHVYCSSSF